MLNALGGEITDVYLVQQNAARVARWKYAGKSATTPTSQPTSQKAKHLHSLEQGPQ